MGSISTQTDFVDMKDLVDFEIQIFLCLVKDNEASTQCSLQSLPNKQGDYYIYSRSFLFLLFCLSIFY